LIDEISRYASETGRTIKGAHGMFTRANALEQFGFPDSAIFEMKPERVPLGMWRIKVSCEDGDAIHMRPGFAGKSADAICSIDQNLVKQIDACVEEASH
jgi:hypothetical protein